MDIGAVHFCPRCCRRRESLLSDAYNHTRSACGGEAAVTFVKMNSYLYTLSNADADNCSNSKKCNTLYRSPVVFWLVRSCYDN